MQGKCVHTHLLVSAFVTDRSYGKICEKRNPEPDVVVSVS